MRKAIEAFEHDFARWDLHIPADAVEARRGGQIREAGWSVRYNFGEDPAGTYLDYYASPRDVTENPPGDDWHVRLYSSGARIELPTVLEAYMYGRDPTWEELERTRKQFMDRAESRVSGATILPTAATVPDRPQRATSDVPLQPQPDNSPADSSIVPTQTAPGALATDDKASVLAGAFAESSADLPYLPLDIGLDVDLDLAPPLRTPAAIDPATGPATRDEPPPRAAGPTEPAVDRVVPTQVARAEPVAVPALSPPESLAPDAAAVATEADANAVTGAVAGGATDEVAEVVAGGDFDVAASDDSPAPHEFGNIATDPTSDNPSVGSPALASGDGDDLATPLPARSLNEVHQGGLVLFYPTADAPVEPPMAAPPDSAPPVPLLDLLVSLDPVPATDVHVQAAPPPEEADASPAEPAGDERRDSDGWLLAQFADDGSLLHDNSPPIAETPPDSATADSPFAGVPAPSAATHPVAKKVFARADPVLTADVATIMGSTDPDSFRPWWYRPAARRIVLAVGAAAAVLTAAVIIGRIRARSAPVTIGREIDSTESAKEQDMPGPAASPAEPAAAPSDSVRQRPAQAQAARPDIDSAPSASTQQQDSNVTPTLPVPSPSDAAARPGDDGVARPIGPGSLPPIEASRGPGATPPTGRPPR